MSGRFAWVRVWPGFGWERGVCAGEEPVGPLIEGPADGDIRYALSNRPAEASGLRAVRLWERRRPVEQGYQQMLLRPVARPDCVYCRSQRLHPIQV